MRIYIIVLLTCKLGFIANETVTALKLIENENQRLKILDLDLPMDLKLQSLKEIKSHNLKLAAFSKNIIEIQEYLIQITRSVPLLLKFKEQSTSEKLRNIIYPEDIYNKDFVEDIWDVCQVMLAFAAYNQQHEFDRTKN